MSGQGAESKEIPLETQCVQTSPHLWHRTISSTDDKDDAIHWHSACDHTSHEIGVTGPNCVLVTASWRFIHHTSGFDRYAAGIHLWYTVESVKGSGRAAVCYRQDGWDCSGKGFLPVVDVADNSYVDGWFLALGSFVRYLDGMR